MVNSYTTRKQTNNSKWQRASNKQQFLPLLGHANTEWQNEARYYANTQPHALCKDQGCDGQHSMSSQQVSNQC